MKRHLLNDPSDDDAITTPLGKWLEKIYAISKNRKIRIIHPAGFIFYAFTFILIAVMDRFDFENNPNATMYKSIKTSYKMCKELYEAF